MIETANRIRARQTALETPLTEAATEAVEHLIREAASMIEAAGAETLRDDASVGILAAKLADARNAIENAATRLLDEARETLPIKDIRVYGLASAAEDGDDYACGVIAMGEPVHRRGGYLI
ncbi:hypothetical protein [Fulvimarina sp. MAC3]|uniref:hypothetical protein n=1 Tax=Fulvimarina sp. MAC3 TaxID=3148887 RepID=UPI0031FDAF8A